MPTFEYVNDLPGGFFGFFNRTPASRNGTDHMLAMFQALDRMLYMIGSFCEYGYCIDIPVFYHFLEGRVGLAAFIGIHKCFVSLRSKVADSLNNTIWMLVPLK